MAIPAIINYFQKTNQPLVKVKKPIILGTLIPALIYLLFVLGIWGISGVVSEDSVSGLTGWIPQEILILVGIFGLISIWSSYIVVGLDIKNSLNYDLKLPNILAGLIVIILPLLLFFMGLQNFLTLVSMVGGIFIALEGIFIALMWLKSFKLKAEQILFKKLNSVIAYILIFVFIGAIIYEIIYL